MATRSFLDKAGLDALWGLIKATINTLVGLVDGKVSKDGDTMSGNLDMGENGIDNCTYIEGGGDNDTVEFQSKIDAASYGFWDGTREGTNTDIVLGDGSFRKIVDVLQEDSSYADTEIPTSDAVLTRIDRQIYRKVNISGERCVLYSALKNLRDNENLEGGQWYRIIDFVTTVNNTNVQSAGHAFDLLVFATDKNTLSETAFAVQHSGDTYFSNSKLDAWELCYCLDNDTTRFAWANTSTGKGVIWYMKDEFGNSAPYDFKNIQYKVSFVDSAKCTPVNAYKATGGAGNTPNTNLLISSSSTYYYTFSSLTGADLSLNGAAYDNTIKENISDKIRYLNFIVLKSPSIRRVNFEHGCQFISIECSLSIMITLFEKNASYIYVSCKLFQYNTFDKGANNIVIYINNGNYYWGYFGIASCYIVSISRNNCRSNTFKSWTHNICLYGLLALSNCFGEEVNNFAWIEQATFPGSLSALPDFTNTPAISSATGYFLYNHIYLSSGYVYVGIPFFHSSNFTGTVEYLVLNKQTSASYSQATPTHYLEIGGGKYGSSTACGILTPPNNSVSTVFVRKKNAITIEV